MAQKASMRKSKKRPRKLTAQNHNKLHLPVFSETLPSSRTLNMKQFYQFVMLGLRQIDRKADRKRRQQVIIKEMFRFKDVNRIIKKSRKN